jgi:hypothetical protein
VTSFVPPRVHKRLMAQVSALSGQETD